MVTAMCLQSFLEDNSCMVAKKHVREKIKEMAKGTASGWVFKSAPGLQQALACTHGTLRVK